MTTDDKQARKEELQLKVGRTPEEEAELKQISEELAPSEVAGEQPVNPEDSSPAMNTTEDPGMDDDDQEEEEEEEEEEEKEEKEPDEDTGRDQEENLQE